MPCLSTSVSDVIEGDAELREYSLTEVRKATDTRSTLLAITGRLPNGAETRLVEGVPPLREQGRHERGGDE